jgi:hypothetical protein
MRKSSCKGATLRFSSQIISICVNLSNVSATDYTKYGFMPRLMFAPVPSTEASALSEYTT